MLHEVHSLRIGGQTILLLGTSAASRHIRNVMNCVNERPRPRSIYFFCRCRLPVPVAGCRLPVPDARVPVPGAGCRCRTPAGAGCPWLPVADAGCQVLGAGCRVAVWDAGCRVPGGVRVGCRVPYRLPGGRVWVVVPVPGAGCLCRLPVYIPLSMLTHTMQARMSSLTRPLAKDEVLRGPLVYLGSIELSPFSPHVHRRQVFSTLVAIASQFFMVSKPQMTTENYIGSMLNLT